MQKQFFKILTAVLIAGLCFGQSNKKWQVIKEDSEKIIYLDTKNISEVGDQLSVWSMFVYKVMSKTDENGRRIGKVKNQYVVNKSTKKYAVVGKLTYDEIGRIIKNNSNSVGPSNQVTTETFKISSDKDVQLIVKIAEQFLKTGSLVAEITPAEEDPEEENTDIETADYEYEETNVAPAKPIKQTPLVPVKTKENKIVFRRSKKQTQDISSAEPAFNDIPKARPVTGKLKYNVQNEQIVRGVIFTDGNIFVVQKSSWREKSKAEKAVRRLKQRGENAFMTTANIPSKGGVWYRVRVGYFNTLSEAEKYVRAHR